MFVRGRLLAADGRPLDHPDRADMKLFVDHIDGGSGSRDKRLFFGADRTEADGTWCAADDEEFGGTAIGVSRALDNRAELVGLIAEALFGHRRRDGHALADMARSFSA